jgi:hypothetical protein
MLPARFRMPNAGTFHGYVVESVSAYSAFVLIAQTQPETLSDEGKGEEWSCLTYPRNEPLLGQAH